MTDGTHDSDHGGSAEAGIDAIDALLAQTQCQACGYPACRPYAEAIASGDAIDKCRPGGSETVRALAALLGRAVVPPAQPALPLQVAWIDPERCIGCARCLPPCPVDAIVGMQPFLHTVLAEHCTGCELCIAPCPVDCIEMRLLGDATPAPPPAEAARERARARWQAHVDRNARRQREAAAQRARRLAERRGQRAAQGPAMPRTPSPEAPT